ncbi:hypothetical protein HRG84_24340 [Flavisolibacter sp. BT320]|nr:hypothetical protein [Flavisolibacter longurius]
MNYLPNITRHFNYSLTGTGWAEVTFANEKQTITFEVSYLTDPLSDLFEALHRLLNKETTTEKVVFVDEPGEHSLVLAISEDGSLDIEIYWSDEWEEIAIVPPAVTNKKLVYQDTDTLTNFFRTVCIGIDELLGRTTIEEYKKQWHHFVFPQDSYNNLKHLVENAR